jgi:hypothetical protein
MTAAFVFSTKTLVDNWYEDRCQPEGSLTGIGDLANKQVRKYETDIAYVGERYDILTRIGRVPNRESFAVPDDGFREKVRTSTVEFADPRSHKEFVAKAPAKPKMINSETIPEVCFEDRRPLPGNARGFGAVLDRHDKNHGIRHWTTTNHDTYGKGTYNRSMRMSRSDPSLLHPCGVSTSHEENRMPGMKVGILCGEEYRNSGNPSTDTQSQRSWVADASLRNIHHGGTKKTYRGVVDNHLSIPIGDGAMSKIRQDLAERQGKLFRVATNVTKGRDQKWGVAVFKDDP